MTIGIFLPHRLGDLVAATPALRTLKQHFPAETRLVGFVRPQLGQVLQGTPWLDEQWSFDHRSERCKARDWALVRRIRQERFDMVLFLSRSFRARVLAWLGGARQRVGYVHNGRGSLLTHKLDWPHRGHDHLHYSMADHYLRLAESIGCPPGSSEPQLATRECDEAAADALWKHLGLRADGRVVLLHSSGRPGSARVWPAAHFGVLARRIATELDHDVLITCGSSQRQFSREILDRANHPRVFSLADHSVDMGVTKSCIRRGRLMLSNDSGMRLVAMALGKPVITVLGPVLPEEPGIPAGRSIDLHLELGCLDCQNRVCPLRHHRCMRELLPERAFDAVARLLEESLAACAA
jgi:heptosyltransferase-2